MDLLVRISDGLPIASQQIEIVERKGLGHPDTICDAVAEHVSVRLCRHYLERFGRILHHNVDKILLCGGSARAVFGGGEVSAPIEIYLSGRATEEFRGERIRTAEIAVDACEEWLRSHLPRLDLARHVRIFPRLRPGSKDLTSLFGRNATVPLANDTSCGVGFAPMTDLERTVLAVEKALNAPEIKARTPAIGEDVKVMGVRRGSRIVLTIACAFVAEHVKNIDDYATKKAEARAIALAAAESVTALSVEAILNAADDIARGDVYLTVTGTSAEAGDDGEVGRGNRANGLITPYRPMTLEAVAGKNPVTHVGKVYNVVAQRIAESLIETDAFLSEASCILVSRIGQPVTDPQVVDVRLTPRDVAHGIGEHRIVKQVVEAQLAHLDDARDAILARRVPLY